MSLKHLGVMALLTFGAYGCGGPGAGPQADADHWHSRMKPGLSADEAHQVLVDNDFQTWSTGRVVYGYRDKVASSDYSNGVSTQIRLDPSKHVSSAETYSSPVSPYPMLEPTYP